MEKLGELLRENPAGLLVLRDELVGLIATWEREGREGERAFFLDGWNGNQSFDTDRIGRGHVSIPNLCMSIFGGIQPDKLTVYLEQAVHALANDGMLQRFQLLVYPDARRWEWRDRVPDKRARDAAFTVFEALADFDPVAWGAAPADDYIRFPHFCFDPEAQSVFIEWSEDLHRARMPGEDEPIIRQHLAKFDKLFPALALILHLVNCAAVFRVLWLGPHCRPLYSNRHRGYAGDMMLKTWMAVCGLAIWLTVQPVMAGPYEDGGSAYNRKDYATAIRLWRPLAEQGDAHLQRYLGIIYAEGLGVPQDYDEAVKWLRMAAISANAEAMNKLGSMYAAGLGVPQDYAQAVKWFRLAAEFGRNAEAQYKLGLIYEKGEHVEQDYVQAHMWANLAAAQGNKEAATLRSDVASRMTTDQIAEAKKRAREWLAEHPKQ